jgi:hypothetical protein
LSSAASRGRRRTAGQYLAPFWWFDWIIMPRRKVH